MCLNKYNTVSDGGSNSTAITYYDKVNIFSKNFIKRMLFGYTHMRILFVNRPQGILYRFGEDNQCNSCNNQ